MKDLAHQKTKLRVKRQIPQWEKMTVILVSDKPFISQIYQEFQEINRSNRKNSKGTDSSQRRYVKWQISIGKDAQLH